MTPAAVRSKKLFPLLASCVVMSHNYALLFHRVARLQVTTCPAECFWSCVIVCLVSFEGGRSLPFTSLSLSALMIKGNLPAHLTTGLMATGQFAKMFLSRSFTVVAVSSLLQKQVLPLSGDCQCRRRLVSCAASLQQLLETAGGGKNSASVFMCVNSFCVYLFLHVFVSFFFK